MSGDPSRTAEDKCDILDTTTGPVSGSGNGLSLWSSEPAVVAGFIAAVVSASEQARRASREEVEALPAPVIQAIGILQGAVRALVSAGELAAYPQRHVTGLGPDAAAQRGPRPSHTCVTLPTERARTLGVLVAARAETGKVVETAERIADEVNQMRSRGLCLSCGYPLDNSPPHPLARRTSVPSSEEQE